MKESEIIEKLAKARGGSLGCRFIEEYAGLLNVVDEILNDKPVNEIQVREIVLCDEYGDDNWKLGLYEGESGVTDYPFTVNERACIEIKRPHGVKDIRIPWFGGERPVGGGRVIIELRNGVVKYHKVIDCRWTYYDEETGSDIVAYTLVEG